MKPKLESFWFVVGELGFGVILSLFFFWLIFIGALDQFYFGETYLDGYILFYSGASLTFFIGVFGVGIPSAVRAGLSNRIWKAIGYSTIFWLISLLLSALLAGISFVFSIYILLVGIVIGFNLGLRKRHFN